MKSFNSIREEGESSFTEKKSVFISNAFPCDDFDSAMAFLEKIKLKTPDANHHVWAFINKEGNVVRFSDDGEPKGTAGMPVLEVMKKEGVTNLIIVVTRYFGGILLGAGGLSRAYARGARDVIEKVGITAFCENDVYSLTVPYPKLSVTEREIGMRKIKILEKSFGEDISFMLISTNEERKKFDAFLSDCSAGKLHTEFVRNEFAPE